LAPSQLPTEPGHLLNHILIQRNILRRSDQLVLALGPVTHILHLCSVILERGLLFLMPLQMSVLKCLPHSKWSYHCHSFPPQWNDFCPVSCYFDNVLLLSFLKLCMFSGYSVFFIITTFFFFWSIFQGQSLCPKLVVKEILRKWLCDLHSNPCTHFCCKGR
jgi:hypothetical protein